MKFIIDNFPKFKPITVSITIESREELKEVVDVIGKAKIGSCLQPVFETLNDRLRSI